MSTHIDTYAPDTERYWITGDRWGQGSLADRNGKLLTSADVSVTVAVTDGNGGVLLAATPMSYLSPGLFEQGPAPSAWFNGQRVVAVATATAVSDNRIITKMHLILDPEP